MERRTQLPKLQGMDPVTLQVTIADALRRPMRQLEPTTLVELLSLSEAEGLDSHLVKDLVTFQKRIAQEMGDIPDGTSWTEFIADIGGLAANTVPASMRSMMLHQKESPSRSQESVELAGNLLEQWSAVPPEVFVLGTGEAKIQRSTRTAKPRGGGESGKTRRSKPKRIARPKVEVDPARLRMLRGLCMERLGGYLDKGLAEAVLVAGVTHKGRQVYGNVNGAEVLSVLRSLLDDGMVRKSAGRWIMERSW